MVGEWLNKNHQQSFNWMIVTFPVCVIVIAQTFYVMIRRAYLLTKDDK